MDLINQFQKSTTQAQDIGLILTSLGKEVQYGKITKEVLHKHLGDIITQLEQLQKDFEGVNNEITNMKEKVASDLKWSKIIMWASVVVLTLSVAACITVLTFGIGTALCCPILGAALITMGLTTTTAVAGAGAGLTFVGFAGLLFAGVKIDSARATQKELKDVQLLVNEMGKLTSELRKELNSVCYEMKSSFEDSRPDFQQPLNFEMIGNTLKSSGDKLAKTSKDTLDKLYDIQASIIPDESCILL